MQLDEMRETLDGAWLPVAAASHKADRAGDAWADAKCHYGPGTPAYEAAYAAWDAATDEYHAAMERWLALARTLIPAMEAA